MKRADGLSQEPARKDPAQSEGLQCVQQTRSRSRANRRCWNPSSRTISSVSSSVTAISASLTRSGSWRWGTSGQVLLKDEPLVVHPAHLAVTPADQCDANPAASIPAGDPLDHRCLARATQRDVPHRDHWHPGSHRLLPAPIERQVPRGHAQSVADRRARNPSRARLAPGPWICPRIRRRYASASIQLTRSHPFTRRPE